MLELGKRQTLVCVKKVDFGVYLAPADNQEEKVLLPIKQVPGDLKLHDNIEVFLYKDSSDRMIATTRQPAITLGEIGRLRVTDVAKVGAFLDWGLEKDLLLPFREQTRKVRKGEEVLAALYIDKSSRLCATMNVYPYLSSESPYEKDMEVEGTIYETSEKFGVFVAVDDKYSALIPRKECYGDLTIGSTVKARVIAVKENGKLDLAVRAKSYLQIEEDAEAIMEVIDEFEGVLPFSDKVSPEVIKREFGLSKAAFKRAVGHLLKEKKIQITENRIIKL